MTRLVACLLVLLAFPVGAAPRVSITLLREVRIEGPAVRLGDIARLRSAELELMQRLVHLGVGRAPKPGESASIQARHLAAWIEREVGLRAEDMDWSGAHESRVERTTVRLSGEAIARAAVDEVRGSQQGRGLAHGLRAASMPRDVQVPRGPVRLQPRMRESGQLGTRTLVWVDVWVSDGFIRSVPVTLIAPATEQSGQPRARFTQATLSPQMAPKLDAAAGGLAVERGETAALKTVAGVVQLESRVQVLEDGRVGDLVRVRHQGGTATLLSARVTGPGQVEAAP